MCKLIHCKSQNKSLTADYKVTSVQPKSNLLSASELYSHQGALESLITQVLYSYYIVIDKDRMRRHVRQQVKATQSLIDQKSMLDCVEKQL